MNKIIKLFQAIIDVYDRYNGVLGRFNEGPMECTIMTKEAAERELAASDEVEMDDPPHDDTYPPLDEDEMDFLLDDISPN